MFEIVRAFRDALGIQSTWAFVLIMGLGFGLVGAGAGWLVDRAYRNTLPKASEPTRPVALATLRTRYTQGWLPVTVSRGSTAFVLQLEPTITDGLFEYSNGGKTDRTWPRARALPKVSETIYIGEFHNYSDKAVVGLTLTFNVAFYEPVPVPVKITQNANGTVNVSFEMHDFDASAVVERGDRRMGQATLYRRDGMKAEGFKPGKVVSTQRRTITLPVVTAGGSATFYIVNRSTSFMAAFNLPREAHGSIGGVRTSIKLERPHVIVQDTVPAMILLQSFVEWSKA